MRLRTTIATATVALGVLAGSAQAAELQVCPHNGCQHRTIQAAVNAAGPGDVINIREGAYVEDVVVPAGKDGIVLRGAQGGVRADSGSRPARSESALQAADLYALLLFSSNVTVDGLMLHNSPHAIRSADSTSGHRIVNNVFTGNGDSVIPDSNGQQRNAIAFNAFRLGQRSGFGDGSAIISGLASNVAVHDNAVSDHPGYFVWLFGRRGQEVSVEHNRADGPVFGLARIDKQTDVSIRWNEFRGMTGNGVLIGGAWNARVTGNRLASAGAAVTFFRADNEANRQPVVMGNDLESAGTAAVAFAQSSLENEATVSFNRLRSGVRVGLRSSTAQRVYARDNWWGCNGGPNTRRCMSIEGDGPVEASRWMTLALDATDQRILQRPGGTTSLRATLLRASDGSDLPFMPGSAPIPVEFQTTAGKLSATTGSLSLFQTSVELTADAGDGADVMVTLDNQIVHSWVDFGPAPSPNPNPKPQDADEKPGPTQLPTPHQDAPSAGGQSDQGRRGTTVAPVVRTAGTCRVSRRLLRCSIKSAPSLVKAQRVGLERNGRRLMGAKVKRVSRAGATTRVDLVAARKVRPGITVLVLPSRKGNVRRTVAVVAA